MSKDLLKRIAKWSLFIAPVGALAYVNRHFYFGNVYKIHKFEESDLSDYTKAYVKKNDLVSPVVFVNYLKRYEHDHFFDKSIISKLNGLNEYNIFLDRTFHDALVNKIEMSDEEKDKLRQKAKLYCIFSANSRVQGHLGIVHGGFTSTLFDYLASSLGFVAADFTPVVTAYLNVDYKKPMKIGTEYIAVVEVDKIEGKKLYVKGKIVDTKNTVHTLVDSLFITAPLEKLYPQTFNEKLDEERQLNDRIQKRMHSPDPQTPPINTNESKDEPKQVNK